MRRPQLLVDVGDYSLENDSAYGTGLRLSELADALSHDCDVRVFAPGTVDSLPLGDAELVTDEAEWDALLANSDLALFTDLADESRLDQASVAGLRIVTENAPPIEHLEYPSLLAESDPVRAHRRVVRTYVRQLELSAHFLCRSKVEKVSLVANLCVQGRLSPADVASSRTLDHLISSIPIGFSRTSGAVARAAEPDNLADFLWTGGIWAFYQPEVLVDAVAVCRDRGIDTSAAFLYAEPVPDNKGLIDALKSRISRRGLADRVLLHQGPLAHDQRDSYLKGARALVVLGRPGIENETCVRLRIRDSRLYGKPLIVDSYGATGAEVALNGPGAALTDPTPESVADAMARCLVQERPGEGIPDERYEYERTVDHFLSWVQRAPHE
ncbi:hypothetical protein [Streptomyces cyaneofuscatus]|uniref:hypothetical protein n=1 Tax=Streptomyces cyaneofuscatus TaxID=66883 RepID=UPI0033BE6401